jgi:alginate O-acetyltransferase complex protein AlgI
MLFNSLQFVFFFPIVVAVYFATPQRFRWLFLLAASYYFYAAWKPEYLVLIFASTLVDYLCGLGMGRWSVQRVRKALLGLSIATNIGILFAFKYLSFFNESVRAALNSVNVFYGAPALDILLPVGISFYTFQSLSYSIDVYRGVTPPQRHFGIFALYVSFFPQLVAGPIERSYRLLPQFFEHRGFDAARAASGLRLMLWGFFLKVVIADRLAVYVDAVYTEPSAYAASALLLATYFFAFQIFCDFAGYSSIAIGAAAVLGYDLMQNFRRPYFATSIREFWGRWHISLSTWFRDYVYIPLGGSRTTRLRWYGNLFAVFAISGLWHGAAWTFVIWGALHGGYLVASLLTAELRDRAWRGVATAALLPGRLLRRFAGAVPASAAGQGRYLQSFPGIAAAWQAYRAREAEPRQAGELPGWIRMVRGAVAVAVTFHLVLVAWVFFRAQAIGDAMGIFSAVGRWRAEGLPWHAPIELWQLRLAVLFIALLLVAQFVRERVGTEERRVPAWARWCADYAMVFGILMFGEFGAQEFIYFQF